MRNDLIFRVAGKRGVFNYSELQRFGNRLPDVEIEIFSIHSGSQSKFLGSVPFKDIATKLR